MRRLGRTSEYRIDECVEDGLAVSVEYSSGDVTISEPNTGGSVDVAPDELSELIEALKEIQASLASPEAEE